MARRTGVFPSDSSALICFSVICVFGGHILIEETRMSRPPTESKRLLSHTIAEWACSLKYEHLSPEAIQAAKLFWFDSIGCALGGSQQQNAIATHPKKLLPFAVMSITAKVHQGSVTLPPDLNIPD